LVASGMSSLLASSATFLEKTISCGGINQTDVRPAHPPLSIEGEPAMMCSSSVAAWTRVLGSAVDDCRSQPTGTLRITQPANGSCFFECCARGLENGRRTRRNAAKKLRFACEMLRFFFQPRVIAFYSPSNFHCLFKKANGARGARPS
jgi:hypothetical protein